MKSTFRKSTLAAAMTAALGLSANARADVVTLSWSGAFTLLEPKGGFVGNTDTGQCMPGMVFQFSACLRTALSGTLVFDTATGAGSATSVSFSFLGSGNLDFNSIDLQAIGNGAGGPGSLLLGNILWSFNANNGIPTSIIWDASGLLSALGSGPSVGQTITGGALPASNNTKSALGTTYPLGSAVMATTTWNTTDTGPITLGTSPSGTLPLLTDTVVDATNGDIGIGGSPMKVGPYRPYNMNIDILSAQVTNIVPQTPIPASVWLFGSGLAGLVSLARRRRGKAVPA